MTWVTLYETITSPRITVESTVFKFLISLIAGGLVGLNRERHKQPAGFRTHILICMGSTLLMVVSIYIPQTYFNFQNGDPGRIAAQVVTGIGFLGAGAIIRLGTNVRGLTTAASIWLISAIGLAIGAGLYLISLVMVVFALFTLIILEFAERRMMPQLSIKTIALEFNHNNFPETQIQEIFKQQKIHLTECNITVHSNGSNHTEVKMIVKVPEKIKMSELLSLFNSLDRIKAVKII
jgi:putative Mg2+ transporter-C (MgtC) family protein